MMQIQKPSLFLTELATNIWTDINLCNRAFNLSRPIDSIPGRSPVKLIERHLLRLLISKKHFTYAYIYDTRVHTRTHLYIYTHYYMNNNIVLGLYNDYLKRNNYTGVERMKYLLDSIYVVRHKIRDLRADEKRRAGDNAPNARKHLRYNM